MMKKNKLLTEEGTPGIQSKNSDENDLGSIKSYKAQSLADEKGDCSRILFAIQDALDLISGKWKIKVISVLLYGKKNFTDLQRQIDGLGAKMLSKELQDLEVNGIITRTVNTTKPITVSYELTTYGHTLEPIIRALADWGTEHRHKITGR